MAATDGIGNYGARQPDISQNIKQFLVGSPSQPTWILKKLSAGTLGLLNTIQVQTSSSSNVPVYFNKNLYVNGDVIANAFVVPSDERLKDNIMPILEPEIQEFHNLEPKLFNYKTKNPSEKHYGFVAQEVEKIYPQLVKDNEYGFKTINYMEMIPLLVLKINEMQKEIDELKEKI